MTDFCCVVRSGKESEVVSLEMGGNQHINSIFSTEAEKNMC